MFKSYKLYKDCSCFLVFFFLKNNAKFFVLLFFFINKSTLFTLLPEYKRISTNII